MSKVFDNFGNEVFLNWAVILTPVEHLALARTISSDYLQSIDVEDFENVLPTPLNDSHFACITMWYCHEIAAMVSWIAASGYSWCGERLYTTADSPEEIKSLFCIVQGDSKESILTHLALSEVE